MYVEYAGIEIKCANCGATRRDEKYDMGFTILSANQYVTNFRVFCRQCCHITDWTSKTPDTPKQCYESSFGMPDNPCSKR